MSGDLEAFSESLDDVFRRLGLPNPKLFADLANEWDSLATGPWAGRSRPLVVRGQTLIVEANAPSMVAFLRYGEGTLLEALAARFGEGVIGAVEVVAPGRS